MLLLQSTEVSAGLFPSRRIDNLTHNDPAEAICVSRKYLAYGSQGKAKTHLTEIHMEMSGKFLNFAKNTYVLLQIADKAGMKQHSGAD